MVSMDSRAIGMPGQPAPAGAGVGAARHSPEARGRPERIFRTPQDRLPDEVALAEIAAAPPAISRDGRRPDRAHPASNSLNSLLGLINSLFGRINSLFHFVGNCPATN